MTISEARAYLETHFFEAEAIIRVTAGIQEASPQIRKYIEALDTVSDFEATHDLPEYTQYIPIPCPKCKGKGIIEKYRSINDGKCYLCNGKGIKFKTVCIKK